ncbi:uncharacterized protein J8A68_000907 [[Candida] subhashii]|uniref:Transmembrane protein n=1 Tax=[Candida] subhashii TaxID=561895 RepID=A0A8J5QT83_9ASCO|nr:uncharacterized protein J8A68_000907 [[Candida] subhashii]KAG7665505.1 hypothetical protein J8A68_000907 [[Candida] subhashii]
MMSRLRKVDKSILEQSSSEPVLLDTEDQTNLINNLSISNQQTYDKYVKYLSYLYIIQIMAIITIQFLTKPKLITLLILLSIALSVINIKFPNYYSTYVKYMNWGICIQCIVLLVMKIKEDREIFCILPVFNNISVWCFRNWFEDMIQHVDQLDKLKYKFKNV